MQIKVLNADYSSNQAQIMASLTMERGETIADDLRFKSQSVSGTWRIYDFARDAPSQLQNGDQNFLVAVVEVGESERLQPGELLFPLANAATNDVTKGER